MMVSLTLMILTVTDVLIAISFVPLTFKSSFLSLVVISNAVPGLKKIPPVNTLMISCSLLFESFVGKYKVCVIPTDNAGNTNTESCHEVELKKIDVDASLPILS